MGWTHNWRRGTELPLAIFATAVRDCQKAFACTGVSLAGFDGTGEPVLKEEVIVFNGKDRADCEPFEIHQTECDRPGRAVFWSFCKTEHQPYDLCVQVALVILKHNLGEAITVGSDGKDDDWAGARQLCQDKLGYGENFQLHTEATG